MTEKMIIAVVGATGSQGGGLVRAILADPQGPFTVRALTRNADSGKARELASQGVEVVEADLDDEASVRKAFDGAYGAFVVTNFWAQRTPEQEKARTRAEMELAQAAAGARAAKDTGLRHVVWSTLEDTRPHFERLGIDIPTVFDSYKVPHFDAKGEANAFFTELGVPTTFLQTTFFYESFLIGQGPHRDENGELVLTIPMAGNKMALIAADDIGKTALGVFRRGDDFIGKTVSIAGALLAPWKSPTCTSSIPTRPNTSPESGTSTWYGSSTPISSRSTPGSTSTRAKSHWADRLRGARIDTSNFSTDWSRRESMDNGLTGKVALVTGGTRKLGRAITRRLAEAGTDVAISDKLRDEGED
jgi:uncharacterized protein YbjT (DUF2867 family)